MAESDWVTISGPEFMQRMNQPDAPVIQNPDGSVEFATQQALQLAMENRTDDPASPVDGQIWLRADL